jgi:hypothetical protein
MPPAYPQRADRLARITLLVAMAISAATILIAGHDLWFWSDELDWLTSSHDFVPRHLLFPHGSHLIAIPRAIYEAFPRIFGVDYLPFRVFAVACLLACAAQAFVLIRRRVGGPPAAAAATVLLFFGSAQEIVVSPLGIPFTLSIALGLAALLAVERRRLGGDVGATALLVLSILSHTFGLIFAIGVAVYYGADRGRRRELWVALIPIALWVIWWIWARQFDQGITSSGNILGAPFFVIEAVGAAVEGLSGLGPLLDGRLDAVLGVTALALFGYRLLRGGVRPWLYAYAAAALAFWFAVALAESAERGPDTPRYLFFGAVIVLLIAAESLRGLRVTGRGIWILAAVFAVAMAGNVARLTEAIDDESDQAREVRAQIAVQDFDAAAIDPSFAAADLGPPASDQFPSTAGELRDFAAAVGPLGYSPDELRAQTEAVRRGADFVLVRALGIGAGEIPAGQPLKTSGCVTRRPAADGYTTFELSPGLNVVRLERDPGAAGATLDLGRFADVPDVEIGTLRAGRRNVVVLPGDGLAEPWRARTTGTIEACRARAAP